ncbi:hypothetical protein K227x_51120 [Rubripirellula lacrimiformis]|uniref:Uncharacterized protein n=1 Tax=Rubripirellula lacrimiformis TaxID=1930273 RepID=A0A517NHS6_9BACT|nr:hypothetical protein [Rubripirellula lacrimiformis]QDT06696.1 hypothetical protein K227x_51120 [Rubripirellula lacrimiformis]
MPNEQHPHRDSNPSTAPTSSARASGSSSQPGKRSEHRPVLIVIFTVAIIWFADRASADHPIAGCNECDASTLATTVAGPQAPHVPIQLDGETYFVPAARLPHTLPIPNDVYRPQYAELSGDLANFDADAGPDGWRVRVVLRNRFDEVVVAEARAQFELVTRETTLKWTVPLQFDATGVASARLPTKNSEENRLGWHAPQRVRRSALTTRSALQGFVTPATAVFASPAAVSFVSPASRWSGYGRFDSFTNSRDRTIPVDALASRLAGPNLARLSVRVSVPTVGVLSAETFVRARPSFLVDTWDTDR